MDITELLAFGVQQGASDCHLSAGEPPMLRVHGDLKKLDHAPLGREEVHALVYDIMSDHQRKVFEVTHECDFSFEMGEVARFRVNVFMQRKGEGAVFRTIPTKIVPLDELGMPPILKSLCEKEKGLILVTGPTGSGKSTTLAAMIDQINSTRTEHIMTIEEPIEFLHRDKKSIINQREVDVDTKQFSSALRSAMRQDPDVILVGEMRDYETIETALLAAETGHLVLSTLHTLDATETVNRIISVFPPHQQKQIRIQLAAVLKSIISMRLLPRADGLGRVPAVEILISTGYIRDCVENKEKTKLIRDAINQGTSQYGMQTFDQSLYVLYKNGLITLEEALRRATNPDEFKLKIQGIQSTSDISREEMDGVLELPGEGPMDPFSEGSPFEFGHAG